ncbi:MAG TPA: potassium-transporting ATPase subunit B, partial [bacterium]|nr:potassium-transporting ATPase subunit B [bacterium]
MENTKTRKLFEGAITRKAIIEAFKKLNPAHMIKNPVMFTVYVGSILTSGIWLQALTGKGESEPGFIFAVSLWLWFTVLFANFAEAMAEGRGKAQADTLRKSRQEVKAKKLSKADRNSTQSEILSGDLRKGDLVLVEAGD